MDRNSFIGILLIGVIVIGYSVMMKPSKEELEKTQRQLDSLEIVKKIEEQKTQDQIQPETEQIQDVESSEPMDLEAARDKLGAFASGLTGEDEYTVIENDLLKLTISNKGGRPYKVQLKKYKTHDSLPLFLFKGDSTIFGLNFYAGNRRITTNELYFVPQTSQKNIVVSGSAQSVAMRLDVGDGKYIEYVYTVEPDNYMVDFDINMVGINEVVDKNTRSLDLTWEYYAPQQEKGKQNENNYSTIYYKPDQDKVEKLNPRSRKDIDEKEVPFKMEWVAFKDQFFSSIIIAEDAFLQGNVRSIKLSEEDPYLRNFRADLVLPYDSRSNENIAMKFYFGPNHFKTLKQYEGYDLQDIVFIGGNILRVINQGFIIPVFNWLDNFIPNYGIIILILTLLIKLILFPLTYKSYMSQAKMRVLKPQIDEINAKIPKEKAMERQQATMALYKKVGVSPMGGCLPMVLQMPILFAMFRFFPTSIELRQQSFLWAHDLSTYDSILNLPFVIPMYGDHVSLFTLLMTISTIISVKTNSQATSSTQMPGMKGMMYIMPVMFMFMLNSWSSGLTYYYFLANMITFGQNAIFKGMVDDEEVLKKLHAKKAKPKKKSGFQARMEEMAKQRGYKLPKNKK